MKRLLSPALGIFLIAIFVAAASAQFTPEELGQRVFWESFLKTARIVKTEKVDEGVTHPTKVTLRQMDTEAKAFWKGVREQLSDGALDDWRFEIAAYRIDKLLGLGLIPPAVERDLDGRPGSLSLFAASKASLLKIMDEGIPIPPEAAPRVNRLKYLTRAFDCLIANDDRTQQNILYTEDWRTILIDHSRAFRADSPHRERLIYGRNGFKTIDGKPMLFRQLPRAFVQAVRGLEAADIRAAVGDTLTEDEVAAIMARKKVLLAEVDDMIKDKGEAAVLY
jgi:hypothetical protein